MAQPDHQTAAGRPTPGPGALRTAVETASVPLLTRLGRLPVWVPVVLLVGLVLGGSTLGGVLGTAMVLLAGLVVGWFLYLTWPRLGTSERLMRIAVLLLVLLLPLTQLIPRG